MYELTQYFDQANRRVVVQRTEHGVTRKSCFHQIEVIMGEAPSLNEVDNDLRIEHRVAYLSPTVVGHS